jgi:hypothetical protein
MGTQNKAVSLHHARQLGLVVRAKAKARGASPFHGWPPGVTRLIGPPCRYKRQIITLQQSV